MTLLELIIYWTSDALCALGTWESTQHSAVEGGCFPANVAALRVLTAYIHTEEGAEGHLSWCTFSKYSTVNGSRQL